MKNDISALEGMIEQCRVTLNAMKEYEVSAVTTDTAAAKLRMISAFGVLTRRIEAVQVQIEIGKTT